MALETLSFKEIHEFGIDIVVNYARKDGFQVARIEYDQSLDPQIIANKNGDLFYILVRTACYPYKGIIEKGDRLEKVLSSAIKQNAKCIFAGVGIANAKGSTDLEMSIPVRGGGFYISFSGFDGINVEKNVFHFAYSQNGEFSGGVEQLPDGRYISHASGERDLSSLIMQTCFVFSDKLSDGQKELFSRWAQLPTNCWSVDHKRYFVLALLHFYMELRTSNEIIPEPLSNIVLTMPPRTLPPLGNLLTNDIRRIFFGLYISDDKAENIFGG